MFRFFKNNKIGKKGRENLEYLTLATKWNAFLKKTETHFNESMIKAEEDIMGSLAKNDLDIESTLMALQGVKTQLGDLIEKIEITFKENVEPKMLEYIEQWSLIEEKQKGTLLGESMLNRIKRFDIVLTGKVSQQIYNHVTKIFNKTLYCLQCNTKIEVKKDIFRVHYVSCDHCNTINTFKPNTKITQVDWVVDFIAKYRAIKEWDDMELAKEKYQKLNFYSKSNNFTEYKKALQKRENTERIFWKKYFKERCVLLPEYEKTLEHDIDSKMHNFYGYRKRTYNF